MPREIYASAVSAPLSITGSPYYIDNFNGPNDTTSLKARGYKVYFRGTGPVGTRPMWFQGLKGIFGAFNGPANGYVASNYETVTGANTIDHWLVLPRLTVSEGDSLYFYEQSPLGSIYPDSIAVMYSALGDSVPAAGSWTMLAHFKTTTTGSWTRRGFRAPAAGAQARWAIRYFVHNGGPGGTNSNYIGIDALTVELPGATNDVGPVANLAPVDTIQANSATIAPKATFQNFGFTSQTAISVSYSISPGGYSSTKTIASLAPGAIITVTFDSTFIPAPIGTYTAKITSNLGTDQERRNDTIRASFTIVERNWGGGGPSTGGYSFANSIAIGAPSRPRYNWIDPVAGGHTQITTWTSGTGDDGYFRIPAEAMQFDFQYFGSTIARGNIFVGTNGYLSFDKGYTTPYDYGSIPDGDGPNNFVAGCAMDLDVSIPPSKVYYHCDATRLVVTYLNAQTFSYNTDTITFQIILFSLGNIKCQYHSGSVTNILHDALVGIEDEEGTLGIQYRNNGYGGPMFSSPLALQYGTNPLFLPIQLASFTGRFLRSSTVRLDWRTISETNNYGFYVQRRSVGATEWIEISGSFVPGQGTTTEPHDYAYTDVTTPNGSQQYRLKQIDLDGTTHYTETIVVSGLTSVPGVLPLEFALNQNYPNPFNPVTSIRFDIPTATSVTLKVYNILGQEVAALLDGEFKESGSYEVRFDALQLASGVYVYHLQAGSFAGTKKMLLTK